MRAFSSSRILASKTLDFLFHKYTNSEQQNQKINHHKNRTKKKKSRRRTEYNLPEKAVEAEKAARAKAMKALKDIDSAENAITVALSSSFSFL